MTKRRHCFTLSVTIGMVFFAGCGSSGPETAPVSGRITFGGKPVAEGSIKFWSTNNGTLAVGQLGANGNYELTTHPDKKGATLGVHRVTIRSVRTIGQGRDEKLQWLAPPRYDDRQTTELTAEVKSGPNIINFDLPAENLPQ